MIGLGRFDGRTVAVIGNQKGRDIKERTHRNFGMAYPEGYRKAMRVMELADRHGFPLSASSTRRAPTRASRPSSTARAARSPRSQAVMARLSVPTIACVIGEGGSGGAIAIGARGPGAHAGERDLHGDLARGLRGDPVAGRGEAKKAAAAFKPDAVHCLELGVIDAIVPEPEGGAHTDHDEAARLLGESLREALDELAEAPATSSRRRRAKFRSLGVFA